MIRIDQNIKEVFLLKVDIFNTENKYKSGVSQIIPYIVPVIQTITNIIVTAMPVIQQIITVGGKGYGSNLRYPYCKGQKDDQ